MEISGSGRTDAGAHALHQIASFHCTGNLPCPELLSQLRRYLPEDIGVYSCQEVPDRFHARLNAKAKTYCYRIWNSRQPNVFQRRYMAADPREVDLDSMKRAAGLLLGRHDFSPFCAGRSAKKNTVRTLYSLDIRREGEELRFTLRGDGFLYNMVRIIVGTLLEVGRGERTVESVGELFGKERCQAGPLVPACGLCLMEVEY